MRLYFIRHAQSADNQFVAENANRGVRSYGPDQSWLNRQADPELSETGRKQAQRLSRFLAEKREQASDPTGPPGAFHDDLDFTHIYASLMIRTIETANAIADSLHLTPAVWEDLHEMGGFWEADPRTGQPVGSPGRNRDYFENRYPHLALPDDLDGEGWWNRPLETASECKERARRLYRGLMARHGDTEDRVAVVSHGLFYSFLANALLKIPTGSKVTFAMNNAAMTRIDFTGGRTSVIYQNRSDYFLPDLIT